MSNALMGWMMGLALNCELRRDTAGNVVGADLVIWTDTSGDGIMQPEERRGRG